MFPPSPASKPFASVGVVGGGPAGLTAALAMARAGHDVVIFLQPTGRANNDVASKASMAAQASRDPRTTAVLGDGIVFLENIGVWSTLRAQSAPMCGIRIIDDLGGWLKAPELLFRSQEIGQDAFGFNVPNDPLVAALTKQAHAVGGIRIVETSAVTAVVPGADDVTVQTGEGETYNVRLAIAADGRNSLTRAAAGIGVRTWTYPQVAIATSFAHSRPHEGISTEFHRPAGPLTTVPLPDVDGPRSSLVWVETPTAAARLMALPDQEFGAELEQRLQGLLGKVAAIGRRRTFPLSGLIAHSLGKGRIVVAGEAAHVLPPIGAQGLNLGFRDAATLANVITRDDPGAADGVAAYDRARAADLVSREVGIDLLNRSLLTDFFPVQALRGLGLHALANSRSLRRTLMNMGIQGPGAAPPLMRPLAKADG